MYGVQHILQRIRRVGVIHYGSDTFGGAYRLQSSGYALQSAHDNKYILWLLAEHTRRTIYGEQIADIELTNKLHAYLMSVHLKVHTLEVALYDMSRIVGNCARGICLHSCLGVLHHYHAILIISIGDSKGTLRQVIEEFLLGITIVLECLMIIKVIAGKIGEKSACESQSAYAFLRYGMAGALHESIFTTSFDHLG